MENGNVIDKDFLLKTKKELNEEIEIHKKEIEMRERLISNPLCPEKLKELANENIKLAHGLIEQSETYLVDIENKLKMLDSENK